jgi:hypothetical protein
LLNLRHRLIALLVVGLPFLVAACTQGGGSGPGY